MFVLKYLKLQVFSTCVLNLLVHVYYLVKNTYSDKTIRCVNKHKIAVLQIHDKSKLINIICFRYNICTGDRQSTFVVILQQFYRGGAVGG